MKLLDYTLTLPTANTPFSIMPFACVHADNEGHSASKWQEYLHEVKNTKHCLSIGLGDYNDWLRTHARDYLNRYGDDETSFNRLHDWRKKAADDFCEKYLDPIRDKLVGLSLGNHFHAFDSGYNDTMYMCDQLKVPYLEKGFFIRLKVAQLDRSAHQTFVILGHHGDGVGNTRLALENKAKGFEADIYILAHNHKLDGTHTDAITVPRMGDMKLVEKQRAFLRCGSFMKGYLPGCVTYAERKLMDPTAIGYVRLDVMFKRTYDAETRLKSGGTTKHLPLRYEFKVTY